MSYNSHINQMLAPSQQGYDTESRELFPLSSNTETQAIIYLFLSLPAGIDCQIVCRKYEKQHVCG
jgi:hypothetical protein